MMKLPYRNKAIVEKRKLTHYLLSLTHSKGKSKARFFRRIGFNESNIEAFQLALLKIGKSNEVSAVKEEIKIDRKTSEAIKITRFDIKGYIVAPNGKKYYVKIGWAINANTRIPRLVTAFPVRRSV